LRSFSFKFIFKEEILNKFIQHLKLTKRSLFREEKNTEIKNNKKQKKSFKKTKHKRNLVK